MISKKILLYSGFFIFNCYGMQSADATLMEFDRECIIDAEGYWASSPDPENDSYRGRYPFPQSNYHPWPGKEEFLKKLAFIEATASDDYPFECRNLKGVYKFVMRGVAFSRLEHTSLGNSEFICVEENKKTRWTDALRSHYIEKYNVKPSREFYNFVMQYKQENQ